MKILDELTRFLQAKASAARAGAARAPHGQSARKKKDPVSAESSLADPDQARLEVARDPERMREVFQGHLRPVGERAYQVQECRIVRMRYDQARSRIILEYTLLLEELDKGGKLSQRVTGVMYAGGRTRQVWEQLRASDPERENPGAYRVFAPLSYIPELDMLVQVFPYDQQLPAVPLLWAGPPPELEPSLLASFGEGDWQTEAWDVKSVRYQAEARAVLRLTMRARNAASGRIEQRRFYAKVYSSKRGEQTYETLRALWDKTSAGGGGFSVGRPIAYLTRFRLLVQEEVPGTSLREILLREDEATPAVRKAARALAALHLDHMTTPQHRIVSEEVVEMKSMGKRLQLACPHLRPELDQIVGAVVAAFEGGPRAPAHCDLALEHILLDGDRLALVDLDRFAEADPILDIARILAQLAVMQVLSTLPHDRAEMAARTFTGEYFAHVPGAWRTRLPPRYAGAILKRAVSLARKQTLEDWPDKVEALVREAQDSLAGKGLVIGREA